MNSPSLFYIWDKLYIFCPLRKVLCELIGKSDHPGKNVSFKNIKHPSQYKCKVHSKGN